MIQKYFYNLEADSSTKNKEGRIQIHMLAKADQFCGLHVFPRSIHKAI